jgi:predicted permease
VTILYRLRSLWRNLRHRDRVDNDLDAELRAVFDLVVAEKIRAGMRPEDARRAATLELGRIESVKEQVRDAKAGAFVDGLLQDSRYGARVLRRNPIFTLTAALSLAIGIGATTTIFTVANALLLRASPGVTEPSRLVDIVPTVKGHFGLTLTPYPVYLDVRERITTLQDVYAYELEPKPLSLRATDAAERVFAGAVTLNYFDALGVPAAAGRVFREGDGEADAGPLVVLSHHFWMRRFGSNPAIVGGPLFINGQPFVVAGVAREGFRGMSVAAPDLWMPAPATADQLMIGGRLKPGVSRAQAAAELTAIGRSLAREHPNRFFSQLEWSVAFSSPLPALIRGMAAAFIGLLMALVSIVLVIACSNVAGVLLARATARRREIAVRVTLGAGRARLVRQLLTETALLFVIGGTAGVALARGLTSLLLAALPAFPVPVNLSLPLDGRVLAFAAVLSLIAAVLSGMAPALHASRADVISALKDESQGPSDRLRLRNAFVVAQVAFSILLVVAAGLLGRALGRVTSLDQGFDARGVEVASIDLSMAGYTDDTGKVFVRELLERLRRLPGVESAALADRVPGGPLQIENMKRRPADLSAGASAKAEASAQAASPQAEPPSVPASWTLVDAGYFKTLRIPLVSGRDFNAADRKGTQPVAIVDESTARRLWPGQEAVGKFLPPVSGRAAAQDPTPKLVIGVARDVAQSGGRRDTPVLVIYAPLQQVYGPRLIIFGRTSRGERMAGAIRALVTAMNPNLPILAAHTLEERQTGPVVLQLRIAALVSGTVGLVGLLLASIGIYGVTSYAISRRTREIGIRMTLGAQRADVVRMVLRQGMSLVAVGAGIGLLLAAVAGRVLAGLLFGLPPLDPVTFGGATLLFAAIGLAACYVPIRRATRISPVEALRYE